MNKLSISTLIFLFSLSLPSCAELKFAYVDSDKVLQQFGFLHEAAATIESSRGRVRRLISAADKEIKELQAKEGKEAEIEAKKAEIQKMLDKEVMNLRNEQVDLNKAVDRKIKTALDQLAAKGGYDLILDSKFVLEAGQNKDVTDEFMKLLEKIN